jgi:hypothetical protein
MVHVKREGVILEGTSLEFENEGVMNPDGRRKYGAHVLSCS